MNRAKIKCIAQYLAPWMIDAPKLTTNLATGRLVVRRNDCRNRQVTAHLAGCYYCESEMGDRAMRLIPVRVVLIGVAAALSGCVDAYGPAPLDLAVSRVDPVDAGERAVVGAALGTALGTGIGAAFAINPAIGAVVGAESGAAVGAAIGAATAQPLPDYAPIAIPATAIIPGFYDTWPPGYHPPPIASQTPPPPG